MNQSQYIEDGAIDAIVRILVDLKYIDEVNIEETIDLVETREIEDHYEEWLSDLYMIFVEMQFNDTLPYQDDMIRYSTEQLDTISNIFEKASSLDLSTINKDSYNIFDNYYKIITQEFPEHVFDA